jgi:hypothetical protein
MTDSLHYEHSDGAVAQETGPTTSYQPQSGFFSVLPLPLLIFLVFPETPSATRKMLLERCV